MRAALVLEDGTVFEGLEFGAGGRAHGEALFYTGIVGYQEVITDPAYRSRLVVMTYPIIGSCGVNADDAESDAAQVSGVIVSDYCAHYSNFRAVGALDEYLAGEGIAGVRALDTRAAALHLRKNGEMSGAIVSGDFDAEAVAADLRRGGAPENGEHAGAFSLQLWQSARAGRMVLLDAGAPRSFLRSLGRVGFAYVGELTDIRAALAAKPCGLLVAGGGIDPHCAHGALGAVREALGELPILGVDLGCELVALALCCQVRRMKAGHRGINHPVRAVDTGRCIITTQHHGFVVEHALPGGVEPTHVNVNDGTIEGIRSRRAIARGVHFRMVGEDSSAPGAILEDFLEGKDA